MARLALRSLMGLAGVAIVTYMAAHVEVNATTVGFAYLLLVLVIASTQGFVEAALASAAATLALNYFFLPPLRTLHITDPQNWVALFSFLATSLIGSRLSEKAKRRALDAIERQQDIERLYSFSRAILLIDDREAFPTQLARKVVEIFGVSAAVLYDRRTGEIHRAGPSEFDGLDDQLRDAASHGASFYDAERRRVITAIRLGTDPIGSLGVQGPAIADNVLQGIANLVAIGLERAKAQELGHEIEAVRRSEQLRITLIDAMAHEFKTPLTAIRAATTSLMADSEPLSESTRELLTVADEEAGHLQALIDDAVQMGRLDTAHIEVHREISNVCEVIREVITSLQSLIDDRPFEFECDEKMPAIALDRRLVKLAVKQLIDNALKYSPSRTPLKIQIRSADEAVVIGVTDQGKGLPVQEQGRIFERFYRSPTVKNQIPGSGLGLSIAHSIARAHGGDLVVSSRPGETTFRMTLPVVYLR